MRIAIVTTPEAASGWRLAGLETVPAADEARATEMLAQMIGKGDYALIAVDEGLLPEPYAAVQREMRGRNLPVLISAPSFSAGVSLETGGAEVYIRRLVAETMGYEIKL